MTNSSIINNFCLLLTHSGGRTVAQTFALTLNKVHFKQIILNFGLKIDTLTAQQLERVCIEPSGNNKFNLILPSNFKYTCAQNGIILNKTDENTSSIINEGDIIELWLWRFELLSTLRLGEILKKLLLDLPLEDKAKQTNKFSNSQSIVANLADHEILQAESVSSLINNSISSKNPTNNSSNYSYDNANFQDKNLNNTSHTNNIDNLGIPEAIDKKYYQTLINNSAILAKKSDNNKKLSPPVNNNSDQNVSFASDNTNFSPDISFKNNTDNNINNLANQQTNNNYKNFSLTDHQQKSLTGNKYVLNYLHNNYHQALHDPYVIINDDIVSNKSEIFQQPESIEDLQQRVKGESLTEMLSGKLSISRLLNMFDDGKPSILTAQAKAENILFLFADASKQNYYRQENNVDIPSLTLKDHQSTSLNSFWHLQKISTNSKVE